jgi:hypothetical protein
MDAYPRLSFNFNRSLADSGGASVFATAPVVAVAVTAAATSISVFKGAVDTTADVTMAGSIKGVLAA